MNELRWHFEAYIMLLEISKKTTEFFYLSVQQFVFVSFLFSHDNTSVYKFILTKKWVHRVLLSTSCNTFVVNFKPGCETDHPESVFNITDAVAAEWKQIPAGFRGDSLKPGEWRLEKF